MLSYLFSEGLPIVSIVMKEFPVPQMTIMKYALSERSIVFVYLSDHLNTRRRRGLDAFVYQCLFGGCPIL